MRAHTHAIKTVSDGHLIPYVSPKDVAKGSLKRIIEPPRRPKEGMSGKTFKKLPQNTPVPPCVSPKGVAKGSLRGLSEPPGLPKEGV